MRYTIPTMLLLQFITASSAYALSADIKIVGTQEAQVPLQSPLSTSKRQGSDEVSLKKIQLMNVKLSPAAQDKLADLFQSETPLNETPNAALPTHNEIDVSRYPVLDQGYHGSCVTFANTGALDIVDSKQDYISQLCNLELGSTLRRQDANYPSGWEGSYSELVLKQINDYGVITKAYQQQYGCAGKFDYPLKDENDTGSPMTVDDFTRHSEMIMQSMTYNMLLTMEDTFSGNVSRKTLLPLVKKALNNGHPVVISFLVDTNYASVGALGTYKMNGDSWIITPAIEKDAKNHSINAGHAVIITAYDDNAVINGPKNTKHVGVITLRNSWGNLAGNGGDYYMSYDYFKKLTTELAEISAK